MNDANNWKTFKIGQLGEVVTGITPSTKNENFWGEGYPFVTPSDFTGSKYVVKTERSITQEGAKTGRIIPKDSVMVTCIATIGEVSLAQSECMTNQQINAIIPGERVSPQFLYYAMLFNKARLKRSAGITVSPIIKKTSFERFLIDIPPVPEQKKIVEILSTVDERIENTNEKINKIKKIRKTAINKFFLNYNNEKKYKLGEIFSLEYGKGLSENMRKKGKYPVMGSNGIIDWHSEYLVKGPGIVVGRKGTIGAVVYTDSDFWPIDTAYYVEVKNKEKVNLKWLSYKLENLKLNKLNMATGVPGLNREIVYEQKISIPEISLQNIVVKNISNIEKRIITEETKKEVLIKIKKSLMNDLLSGKKRVRIP